MEHWINVWAGLLTIVLSLCTLAGMVDRWARNRRTRAKRRRR